MPPWIGPGPHDRDLDHQVVELVAASAAAACSSARATRSGTRRRCRRAGSCRRRRGSSAGMSLIAKRRAALRADQVERAADARTACRAPARRLSAGPALRGRPCPTGSRVRSGIAAFSIGTSSAAARARSRSRRRAATDGAESRAACRRAQSGCAIANSRDRSRLRASRSGSACRLSHHASDLGETVDLRRIEARAPCRRRAARSCGR